MNHRSEVPMQVSDVRRPEIRDVQKEQPKSYSRWPVHCRLALHEFHVSSMRVTDTKKQCETRDAFASRHTTDVSIRDKPSDHQWGEFRLHINPTVEARRLHVLVYLRCCHTLSHIDSSIRNLTLWSGKILSSEFPRGFGSQ